MQSYFALSSIQLDNDSGGGSITKNLGKLLCCQFQKSLLSVNLCPILLNIADL